jgi:hypothetical protein
MADINLTSSALKEWSSVMKSDVHNYLSALMSLIAKKAKDNLRKNKNIDTGTLAESIKAKAVYTKGKKNKQNKIWAGVGIDRNTRGQKNIRKQYKTCVFHCIMHILLKEDLRICLTDER